MFAKVDRSREKHKCARTAPLASGCHSWMRKGRLMALSGARGVLAALAIGARMMLRRPWLAAAFFAAILAQGILQGLLLWSLRAVLLGFSRPGGGSHTALLLAGGVVFMIWLTRAAATYGADLLGMRLAHGVEIASVRELIAKMLTLSVRFFDRTGQGELVMASYHDLKSVREATYQVALATEHLARLIGLVVVAWLMSPTLAIIGLVLVPLGFLPAHWLGRRVSLAAQKERETIASLSESFMQLSDGIRTIKASRAEPQMIERVRAATGAWQRVMLMQAKARGLSRLLFETVSGIGLVLVLVVGGAQVARGDLEWQSLLSLLVAVLAVYSPMLGLLHVYGSMSGKLPSLDRVQSILAMTPEIRDIPGARAMTGPPETIALDGVEFSYDGGACLHAISATFHRGETIGIVGPSGAGKSTLLALLLRFYDPTRGAILVDGKDLRTIRHADFLDLSALVLQEPFLFGDTIANNIRIGRPNATMDQIVAAARAANLHDEVVAMDDGYDTIIGHGPLARGLSGGQRQRVCIAAAVLKNAPLLFLDEATSSLDSVSEEAVQSAIGHLMEGRTTFVIAHRLSTLRRADRILVLDKGRLVGIGPHEGLLETCDTYRALWASQRAGLIRPESVPLFRPSPPAPSGSR